MVLEGGHPAPSEWPSCEISNQAVKLAAPTSDLDLPAAVSHQKDSLFLMETCTTHNAHLPDLRQTSKPNTLLPHTLPTT